MDIVQCFVQMGKVDLMWIVKMMVESESLLVILK